MLFKKGHIPWNKDKKLPYKSRPSMKGRTVWNKGLKGFLAGEEHYLFGKHRSEETKEKIRKKLKGKKFTEYRRKYLSEVRKGKYPREYYQKLGIISVIKQGKNKEPTSIEKKVYDELKARGILFETQKVINGKFIVDAYIPSLNLVIEADGDYWHSLPKAIKRDKAENAYLTKCGYDLLRLTGTEIRNDSFKLKLDRSMN